MKEREYDHARDFLRVRDFLSTTFALFGKPINWRIERWNYARYFIAPMLGAYGDSEASIQKSKEAIGLWEYLTQIWEDEKHGIQGVVTLEHPDLTHPGYGEIFVQRHPDQQDLLEPMLEYAEANLFHPDSKQIFVYVQDEDAEFISTLIGRGYTRSKQEDAWDAEYTVGELLTIEVPDNFGLKSMADVNDIEERREVFGRAFNHPDPIEWPSTFSYQELQRAPDYRHDLDLYIVSPEGKHVAFCIVWYDDFNHLASLEPVGTHPDYRGLGLGRAVVLHGIQRAAALGANRVQVGSGQRFYEALGFRKRHRSYRWSKTI
jgi:predicted N-acetyltransferase YhbS